MTKNISTPTIFIQHSFIPIFHYKSIDNDIASGFVCDTIIPLGNNARGDEWLVGNHFKIDLFSFLMVLWHWLVFGYLYMLLISQGVII